MGGNEIFSTAVKIYYICISSSSLLFSIFQCNLHYETSDKISFLSEKRKLSKNQSILKNDLK